MTDSQQCVLTVTMTDKRGNPVPFPPGSLAPAWMVDTPSILSLTPTAGGSSCTIAALGPLGDAKVSVLVSDTQGNPLAGGGIDVTIVSGAPSQVTVDPGTPTEQP